MAMPANPGAAAAPDLNDVTYDAFLANDRTLADPEVVKVEPGGRVLLRVINGSAMSNFHLDLGALGGELIAVDGFRVQTGDGAPLPGRCGAAAGHPARGPPRRGGPPDPGHSRGTARRTGIVLVAGAATIARIPDKAAQPSPALSLELERSLRAVAPLAPRKPDRVHKIELTGDMASYVWSINNVPWTKDVPPLRSPRGSGGARHHQQEPHATPDAPARPRIPGRRNQRANGSQERCAIRCWCRLAGGSLLHSTPTTRLVALHCHLLYHLEAGMFTTFRYV